MPTCADCKKSQKKLKRWAGSDVCGKCFEKRMLFAKLWAKDTCSSCIAQSLNPTNPQPSPPHWESELLDHMAYHVHYEVIMLAESYRKLQSMPKEPKTKSQKFVGTYTKNPY